MNKKLVILSGVSGSGKSTFAREWVAREPLTAYIERDMLRQSIFHLEGKGILSKDKEAIVTERQVAEVEELFRCGFQTVIISDTNLSWKNINKWKQLSQKLDVDFEHKKIEVSLKTALERNSLREDKVPEQVIKRQYSQYLRAFGKTEYRPLILSSKKENAVITDMDGTVRLMNGRSPYDAMKAGQDMPNASVILNIEAVVKYHNWKFIVLSGATDDSFDIVYDFWCDLGLEPDLILMREVGDQSNDAILKKGFYHDFIEPVYNVMNIWDDRNQVVKMWRELGLHCFQVADGDF